MQEKINGIFDETLKREGLDPAAYRLTLVNAELDAPTMTVVITLSSEKPVEKRIVERLKLASEKAMPGINAVVVIEKTFKKPLTKKSFDAAKSAMTDYVGTLRHSKILLESALYNIDENGNLAIVPVYAGAHDILRRKGCEELIEGWLDSRFTGVGSVRICEAQVTDKPDFKKIQREIAEKAAEDAEKKKKKKKTGPVVLLGQKLSDQNMSNISDVSEGAGTLVVEGDVFEIAERETRGGRLEISFAITDYAASCTARCFIGMESREALLAGIVMGARIRLRGDCAYDRFAKEVLITAHDIVAMPSQKRRDEAEEKRVELHFHTKMSSMDAVCEISDAFKRAKEFGHDALAITDHGVIQAFPNAFAASKKTGVRMLAGIEAYLVDDEDHDDPSEKLPLDGRFCVFDIETTGLDKRRDEIIEIGAAIVDGGVIRERYNSFVKPTIPLPEKIIKLTGIDDTMLVSARGIADVLPEFLEFAGDLPFVAHNAEFDIGFVKHASEKLSISREFVFADTLVLARRLIPDMKSHKLNNLTKRLGIALEDHHRAVDDALACANILIKLSEMIREAGGTTLGDSKSNTTKRGLMSTLNSYHCVIFAKNQDGLRDLYQLITESHLEYFYRRPRMPKSRIRAMRQNLVLGSACEAGELFRAVLDGKNDDEIERIAAFYDYLEIQPDGNNRFLIREGELRDEEELHDINRKILALGRKLGKPVAATGDVHYIDQSDAYFREILQTSQGYNDISEERSLYYRTTEEMLEEFSYLGEEDAYSVVVAATREIADSIEEIVPIPEGLHTPVIEGSDDQVRDMAWKCAHDMYGENLPEIVEKRLEKELNGIILNGYSVLYLIAQKLVSKSLSDGYLVGSRGSVGSSFAAHMCGITEINSLPPHYRCKKCKFSDFNVDQDKYAVGPDLPKRECPVCGEMLLREGYDIPFEVFMGFKGNKVPDIDLNFSGEYQPVAHRYTEELFGKGQVFRAGTVGTIADKTAYGYVKHYLEEKGMQASEAEMRRLVIGCTGIKRTTGQHPAGMVVLPQGEDINRFTPLQHPADDETSEIITSHFEFSDMHDTLVKLDILGHVDPTVIRMLEDMTGVNAREIDITDDKIISLFSSTEALGVTPEEIGSEVGTYGIPEFGTSFVRGMLVTTRPTSMAELIRISGLSHGTDVWTGNAEELVKNGTATLREAICTRDDIMNYLMKKMEPLDAFEIMESVRKGKGLVLKRGDMEPKMVEAGVDPWFIESCKKIKYMFPKAHAAAYVMMGLRIAWFKVYRPKAFYASYFTARTETDFDAALMTQDAEGIKKSISSMAGHGKKGLNPREKTIVAALEIVREMYARGIHFSKIDIYKSDATRFLIDGDDIRPPLAAISGLGVNAAKAIVQAREASDEKFRSIEDFRKRCGLGTSLTELVRGFGLLDNMHETDQMSLFENF